MLNIQNRIGEEENFNREASLYDWVSGWGTGMSGLMRPQDLPSEMFQFMITQYQRFGVENLPDEILLSSAWATFHTIDYIEPYSLYHGLSDVDVTENWAKNTYDVVKYDGTVQEADPEITETFVLVPDQGEKMFYQMMQHPGFDYKELGMVGDFIEEYISATSGITDENSYDQSSIETKLWLDERCAPFVETPPELDLPKCIEIPQDNDLPYLIKPSLTNYKSYLSGVRHKGMDIYEQPLVRAYYEAELHNDSALKARLKYFEMGAWAALAWIISPTKEAFEFRESCWDMFYMCHKYGECVINGGTVLKREDYTKTNRPVKSCYQCGLPAWCVEMTYINGVNRYLCEKHLNGELPKIAPVTCGTKVCRFTECPHHPLHGMANAQKLAYRQSGMLRQMVNQNTPSSAQVGYSRADQKLLQQ